MAKTHIRIMATGDPARVDEAARTLDEQMSKLGYTKTADEGQTKEPAFGPAERTLRREYTHNG